MFVGKRVTIDPFKDAFHKCKSSTHILVRQHLDAHYRKVLSSKGAIDTSSPYAFKPSCIDQNRMYPENHHLPGSRCVTSFRKKYIFDHNLQFSNDPMVDHLVKSYFASLRSEATGNILGSFVGDKRDSPKTHNNCNTFTRPVTRSISEAKLLSGARRLEPDSYDILQIHQHKFTTQKPFSPRTIRSNASSKLRSLRCYNPPVRRSKSHLSSSAHQGDNHQTRISNVLGNRNKSNESRRAFKSKPIRGGDDGHTLTQESPSSFSRKMKTAVENYSMHRPKTDSCVLGPKIHTCAVGCGTTDAAFVNSSEQANGRDKVDQWLETCNDGGERDYLRDGIERVIMEQANKVTGLHSSTTGHRLDNAIEHKRRMLAYLNFIEAVTNDVLERGVFTDKNLNSILHEHVTYNRFGLGPGQLEEATKQLRAHLRITDDMDRATGEQSFLTVDTTIGCGDQYQESRTIDSLMVRRSQQSDGELRATSALPPPAPTREIRTPAIHVSHRQRSITKENHENRAGGETCEAGKQNQRQMVGVKELTAQEFLGPVRLDDYIQQSDSTAEHWESSQRYDHAEHEDTLNDQLSSRNFSVSAPINNTTEDSGVSKSTSQVGTTRETALDAVTDCRPKCKQPSMTKNTRVAFASEDEFLSTKDSDITALMDSSKAGAEIKSPDNSSQKAAQFDTSSFRDLDLGDHTLDEKEYSTSSYLDNTWITSEGNSQKSEDTL